MRNFYFKMAPEGDDTGSSGRDFTKEATEMGWHTEDKWTGDPAKWLPAKEYVERGEKVLPIVTSKLKATQSELAAVRAELASATKDFQEVRGFMERASASEKAVLEGQLAEALAARKEAVTTGDGEAFEVADKAVDKIKKAAEDIEKKKQDALAARDPAFDAWLADNQWYAVNEDLRMEANSMGPGLAAASVKRGKPLQGRALYDEIAVRMKKLYPDRFESSDNDTNHQRVEDHKDTDRTDSTSRGKGKARTYDNLPADAKTACERYISKGLLKGKPEEIRKKYAENYQWD